MYEVSDVNKTLEYFLPNILKVKITVNDIRIKFDLKINQTLMFTKTSFFCTTLGFIQSYSGPLGDIESFSQLIPGTCKGDRPINITSIDKVQMKCDCMIGSIVNGIKEPVLYWFSLYKPPGRNL